MKINNQYQEAEAIYPVTGLYIDPEGSAVEKSEMLLSEHRMDVYINDVLTMKLVCTPKDLAGVWFGDGDMTEELEGPAEFIINSGAFGTFEQYQKWSYERYKREQGIKSKKGFFFRRMFMERERMEFIYPILKKYPLFLPFCWVHRLFKAVLFNRGRVKMEMDNFREKK